MLADRPRSSSQAIDWRSAVSRAGPQPASVRANDRALDTTTMAPWTRSGQGGGKGVVVDKSGLSRLCLHAPYQNDEKARARVAYSSSSRKGQGVATERANQCDKEWSTEGWEGRVVDLCFACTAYQNDDAPGLGYSLLSSSKARAWPKAQIQ